MNAAASDSVQNNVTNDDKTELFIFACCKMPQKWK